MARVSRRKPVQKSLVKTTTPKSAKRKTKQRKRKSQHVRSLRPKYGCGRLHWNMRNHGKIDVRRRKNKKSTKAAMKVIAKENIRKSAMLEYSEREPSLANESGKDDHSLKAISSMAAQTEQTTKYMSAASETPLTGAHTDIQVDTKTETEDKQVSAHLIYDDDDDEDSVRIIPDAEDSLMDVATVPDHESPDIVNTPELPPAFPWNKEDNFNNSNNKYVAEILRRICPSSAAQLLQEYVEGSKRRVMPNRKCAVYARVKINHLYKTKSISRRRSNN